MGFILKLMFVYFGIVDYWLSFYNLSMLWLLLLYWFDEGRFDKFSCCYCWFD